MKKSVRRILALFLALLMMFTAFSAALAAEEKVTPVVVVSGLGSFPSYFGDGKDEKKIWPPQTGDIMKVVARALLPLAKTAIKRDWNEFADGSFEDAYQTLFEIFACDKEGNPLHEIKTVRFPLSVDNYPELILNSENNEDEVGMIKALSKKIGAENIYFFNYDWRLNPLEHVDDLKAFIDNVKKEKNADEVILIPGSMGGTVVNSYLYKYGSSGIKKIVYALVASKGIDLVGELFGKNLDINTETLLERLYNFENGNVLAQHLLGLLSTVVEITPVISKMVDSLVNSMLESLNDRAYNEVLSKSFATMPGLWSFCPDSYYEADKKMMFGENGNEKFIAKIDEYHYNVQNKAEALMKAAEEKGCEIYVTASYGMVGFPVTKAAYTQSDCLIETKNESFGAITSPYNSSFPKDYKAAGTVCNDPKHNHVSSDLCIDASSCAFPEQTWFIKHMKHIGFPCGTQASDLLCWLVLSEEKVDIYSNEKYPQFTDLNLITGKLTSLTGDTAGINILDGESTMLSRLVKFVLDIYYTLEKLFDK